nr:MAG TPA: hypothetical protein [Caudoviricetes sp.]
MVFNGKSLVSINLLFCMYINLSENLMCDSGLNV